VKKEVTDTTNAQQSFHLLWFFPTDLLFVVPLLGICCVVYFIDIHNFK